MKIGEPATAEDNDRFAMLMSKPGMKCSIRGGEYHVFEGHEDIDGRKCACCGIVPWQVDPRRASRGGE
jgi:hypothetical protein